MKAAKIEIQLHEGRLTITDAEITGEGLEALVKEKSTNHILQNRMTLTVGFNYVRVAHVGEIDKKEPQP